MFWAYILFSKADKKLYVGQTANLAKRLALHDKGLVSATKLRRPLTLIHSESYTTRKEAMAREKFMKSLWGARFKKSLVAKFLKRGTI
jgi:putative endonuclease